MFQLFGQLMAAGAVLLTTFLLVNFPKACYIWGCFFRPKYIFFNFYVHCTVRTESIVSIQFDFTLDEASGKPLKSNRYHAKPHIEVWMLIQKNVFLSYFSLHKTTCQTTFRNMNAHSERIWSHCTKIFFFLFSFIKILSDWQQRAAPTHWSYSLFPETSRSRTIFSEEIVLNCHQTCKVSGLKLITQLVHDLLVQYFGVIVC